MFFGKSKTDGQSIDESITENAQREDGAETEEHALGENEAAPQTGESESIIEDDAQEAADRLREGEDTENEEPAAEKEEPEEEIDDFDIIEESNGDGQTETQEEQQADEEPEADKQPEETDEERAARLQERRKKLQKAAKISGITLGGLAVVYFAGVAFYNSHFFFGTTIGSYNCSNMSLSKAEEHITTGIENYSFAIYENNDVVENITGEEVGLATVSIESIEDIKAKQNPFMWP
ncbi:MAG: hypothetical protein ACI4EA_11360, partial [Candidatus Ornithomonoglobus sp.]